MHATSIVYARTLGHVAVLARTWLALFARHLTTCAVVRVGQKPTLSRFRVQLAKSWRRIWTALAEGASSRRRQDDDMCLLPPHVGSPSAGLMGDDGARIWKWGFAAGYQMESLRRRSTRSQDDGLSRSARMRMADVTDANVYLFSLPFQPWYSPRVL
ncbi:hypothetical protein IWZ03DRAFT_366848 [Phyllosticta citriasiana]|uniref:Secreted protein n=2 Tax=Phyllosticta citriasiana TaxID=595635 RepID=A0ABR1L229_9PEZI